MPVGSPSKLIAAHAQRLATERAKLAVKVEQAKKRAADKARRAEKAAILAAKKAAIAEARAKAAALKAKDAHLLAGKDLVELSRRIAAEETAAGKLTAQMMELALIVQQFPDLGRAYFEELKGVVGKRAHSPMPDGAAVKIAKNGILETVADRFDELEGSAIVSIDETDNEPMDQWQPTRAEFEFVKRVFFPELFAPRPRPEKATASAPASPDRIEEMAGRYAAGEHLYHKNDATPENTGKKLSMRKRFNGGSKEEDDDGLQVVGWEEEEGAKLAKRSPL